MEFSVVIPTYGRPDALLRCLDGVARQSFPPEQFEVIVVDDASPQPVSPQLDEWKSATSLRHLRLDRNGGPAVARNAGAALARGRYLAFLDDDCVPDPQWLAELARCTQDAGQPAIGGRVENGLPHDAFSWASHVLTFQQYDRYERDPRLMTFFATANLAVPAEAFQRLGGFDTRLLRAYEDRDFCDRWLAAGQRFVYASRAMVAHFRAMQLRGFLRQHFFYGYSARFYYRRHGSAGNRAAFHLPRFLAFLTASVYRREGFFRAIRFALLAGVAQAASLAGYLVAPSAPRDPAIHPQGSGHRTDAT